MQPAEAHCENKFFPFAPAHAVFHRISEKIKFSVSGQPQKRYFQYKPPLVKIYKFLVTLLVMTMFLLHPVIVGSALNRQSILPQPDLHKVLTDIGEMAFTADRLPKELNNNTEIKVIEPIEANKELDKIEKDEESDKQADLENTAEEKEFERDEDSFPPYNRIIHTVAERYNIDPALIRAVIMVESSNNPKAVSRSGAKGLMQLMPGTAKELGVEDIFNPEDNIEGGTKYLHRMLARFDGDVKRALAAYNAGSRHVLNYGGVPPFRETQQYVKKVLAHYEKLKVESGVQLSAIDHLPD